MKKGYIVDEIVIDANMNLQWPHRFSLMAPSPTCSALDTLQSGFWPWIPYRVGLCLEAPCKLYPVDKVLVPTMIDLGATTLLKMLKTLEMVLKPL